MYWSQLPALDEWAIRPARRESSRSGSRGVTRPKESNACSLPAPRRESIVLYPSHLHLRVDAMMDHTGEQRLRQLAHQRAA